MCEWWEGGVWWCHRPLRWSTVPLLSQAKFWSCFGSFQMMFFECFMRPPHIQPLILNFLFSGSVLRPQTVEGQPAGLQLRLQPGFLSSEWLWCYQLLIYSSLYGCELFLAGGCCRCPLFSWLPAGRRWKVNKVVPDEGTSNFKLLPRVSPAACSAHFAAVLCVNMWAWKISASRLEWMQTH